MAKENLLTEARQDGLPSALEQVPVPKLPAFIGDKRKLALWIRMLFSALVDADFLDTERFYQGAEREALEIGLSRMAELLENHVAELVAAGRPTAVNAMRARVANACRASAELPQGAFTLTVPTGGGKTLASLLFALRHAIEYKLRRVIVVIPFTSIIEQTAQKYRDLFGGEAVIEHHSSVDADKETHTNRLACENWDAPLVVTTSVQFFESLFANRTSKCRKLHRIAESVVIFDEVQTFPVHLLAPVCDVLKQLSSDYRTTLIFCTATQPALGIPGTREIVSDVEKEFTVVASRCDYVFPKTEDPIEWQDIAGRIASHDRVLAVVSKRKDAEELARLVGEDCFHLSARMCPAHRLSVLGEIRGQLGEKKTRVVSTQVIEAGVDIDFPVVYRAFAGADSLAQAAGRCNREGGPMPGRMHVFFPPSEPPKGTLLTAKQRACGMWRSGKLDLRDPATFREYFRLFYGTVNTDPGVLSAEQNLNFQEVADLFRMIESTGETVIAPYGEADSRINDVRWKGANRATLRRLQPFAVQLYQQEVRVLAKAGAIDKLDEKLWAVVPAYKHVYSTRFGFTWQGGKIYAEPEELIA